MTFSSTRRPSSRGRPGPGEHLPAHLGRQEGQGTGRSPCSASCSASRSPGTGRGRSGRRRTARCTDAWLTERIRAIHEASSGRYGSPRVHADAGRAGDPGRREARGAADARWRAFRAPTGAAARAARSAVEGVEPFGDLVGRDFRPDAPDRVWVRRHQADQDRRGLAVPGRRAGPLQPPDRRLGDGRHMRTELVVDALQMAVAAAPAAPRARSTTPTTAANTSAWPSARPPRRRHRAIDGRRRLVLRQRRRRDVLRDADQGAAAPRRPEEDGRPAPSCARRSSSTSRASTTRPGCTRRWGCAPRSSTKPTTPPATPTASRARARARAKNCAQPSVAHSYDDNINLTPRNRGRSRGGPGYPRTRPNFSPRRSCFPRDERASQKPPASAR